MMTNILNKVKNLFKIAATPDSPEAKSESIYAKYKHLFEKKVFTEVKLPDEDQLCAQVAGQSYLPPQDRQKAIITYVLDEALSERTCCIYADSDKKICIIWYRWTNMKDFKDISSDAQIILDIQGIDPRVKQALKVYDIVKRKYIWYQLRVCWHSLGWTLTYIVGKHREPDRCVAFNPGISFNTLFVQMIQDTLQGSTWTKHTYTYKILGDILSMIWFVGHVKTFVVKAKDPLSLHAMNNFLKS